MPTLHDQEWAVLQALKNQDTSGNQREIAQGANLSLGLTNAILKKLIKKGILIAKKINGRNLSYVLTPVGMDEFSKRAYRYVRRTLDNVKNYKDALRDLIKDGKKGVHLVGLSQLDFIIEYHCLKNGISFTRGELPDPTKENFFSEDREMDALEPGIFLKDFIWRNNFGKDK